MRDLVGRVLARHDEIEAIVRGRAMAGTEDLTAKRDALIVEMRQAVAAEKAARVAEGWDDLLGWNGRIPAPGERDGSRRAGRRIDELFRQIQQVEHEMRQAS